MATLKTTEDIYEEIDQLVAESSQRAVAERLCVSQPFLCDLRKRRRLISDRFAAKLGYERVVRWQRLEKR